MQLSAFNLRAASRRLFLDGAINTKDNLMNDLIILTFDDQEKVKEARRYIQEYGKEELLVFDGTTARGSSEAAPPTHKRRWWLRAPAAAGGRVITAARYTLALAILAAGTLTVQYAHYIANDDEDDATDGTTDGTVRTEALFLVATEDLPDELVSALQQRSTTMTQTSVTAADIDQLRSTHPVSEVDLQGVEEPEAEENDNES